MNKTIVFENEREKQQYIDFLCDYARSLAAQNLKKIPNYAKIRTEHEIAVQSFICCFPEYCEIGLIKDLMTTEIADMEYKVDKNRDERISTKGSNEFPFHKINVQRNKLHYFDMPHYNIDNILHELIHETCFYNIEYKKLSIDERKRLKQTKFKPARMFVVEGVVEGATQQIVRSVEFKKLCKKYNYTPIFASSNYNLEVAITGLVNLVYDDDLFKWHTLGDGYDSAIFSPQETELSPLGRVLDVLGSQYTDKRDRELKKRKVFPEYKQIPIKYNENLPHWVCRILRDFVGENLMYKQLDERQKILLNDYLDKIDCVFRDLNFPSEELNAISANLRKGNAVDFAQVDSILDGIECLPCDNVHVFGSGKDAISVDYPYIAKKIARLEQGDLIAASPVANARHSELVDEYARKFNLKLYGDYLAQKYGHKLQVKSTVQFLQKVDTIALANLDFNTLFFVDKLLDNTQSILPKKSEIARNNIRREVHRNIEMYMNK